LSRNSISISAEPEAVFDVLDNPYAYPRWVVGTRRVRAADPTWPAVGSQLHHAVGTALAELHDSTKVLERARPQRVLLEARARPTGVAEVDIVVAPSGSGSVVTLAESPVSGPLARLPRFVTDPFLTLRNAVSLQRLRHEVERSTEKRMKTP
jgi:uncharacterized protein YndB with AHSA1/START domain